MDFLTEEHLRVFVVIFTVLGGAYAGYTRVKSKLDKVFKIIDDQLNNAKPDQKDSIRDVVYETRGQLQIVKDDQERIRKDLAHVREWHDQYQGGPLDTGDKVVNFVEQQKKNHEEILERLDQCHRLTLDKGCPLRTGEQGEDCGRQELPGDVRKSDKK